MTEIAEKLMADAALPMLGCEDAHIAAGAPIRSLENAGAGGLTGTFHVSTGLEDLAAEREER